MRNDSEVNNKWIDSYQQYNILIENNIIFFYYKGEL